MIDGMEVDVVVAVVADASYSCSSQLRIILRTAAAACAAAS